MKPNQNSKGKLQLKKQAISNLTNAELDVLKGGYANADVSTSYTSCTGRACCGASQACGIWITVSILLTKR